MGKKTTNWFAATSWKEIYLAGIPDPADFFPSAAFLAGAVGLALPLPAASREC